MPSWPPLEEAFLLQFCCCGLIYPQRQARGEQVRKSRDQEAGKWSETPHSLRISAKDHKGSQGETGWLIFTTEMVLETAGFEHLLG
jgi:hypothetical protein